MTGGNADNSSLVCDLLVNTDGWTAVGHRDVVSDVSDFVDEELAKLVDKKKRILIKFMFVWSFADVISVTEAQSRCRLEML